MIIFFGPAGAGKSMQGQMLAARHGWRWLSTGQLLRESQDPELIKIMQTGELVPDEIIDKVIFDAIDVAKTCDGVKRVIVDGYPRLLSQAKSLVAHETERCGENGIDLIVVLEVPKSEIMRRLAIRGRMEDDPDTIEKRLRIYRGEIYPLLEYFNDLGTAITHIDGTGTVGEVHDRVEAELLANKLVEPL